MNVRIDFIGEISAIIEQAKKNVGAYHSRVVQIKLGPELFEFVVMMNDVVEVKVRQNSFQMFTCDKTVGQAVVRQIIAGYERPTQWKGCERSVLLERESDDTDGSRHRAFISEKQ